MSYFLSLITSSFFLQVWMASPAQITVGTAPGVLWLWLIVFVVCGLAVAWLLQRESVSAANTSAQQTPVMQPQADTSPGPMDQQLTTSIINPGPDELQTPSQPSVKAVSLPASVEQIEIAEETLTSTGVVKKDDLTTIEGIGPKIKRILQDANVQTFSDLARTDVNELKQILLTAGLRVNNPATWPAQAALAAAGRWDDLKTMQSQLKSGRRN